MTQSNNPPVTLRRSRDDEIVRGTIIDKVRGGFVVDIGVQAFLPYSHLERDPRTVFCNEDAYIGRSFAFKVAKRLTKSGKRLVSRKVLLDEEIAILRAKTLEKLPHHVGKQIPGRVVLLHTGFAIIDLGGFDAFMPLHEITWNRLSHPEEILELGQDVDVKLLKFNPEQPHALVSIKALTPDPWESAPSLFSVGDVLPGRVYSIIECGVFVLLDDFFEGLMHIDHMPSGLHHPSQMCHERQSIMVEILNIDVIDKKLTLGWVEPI